MRPSAFCVVGAGLAGGLVWPLLQSTVARAQTVPAPLAGRSIALEWIDQRSELNHWRNHQSDNSYDFSVTVYLGIKGHIFSVYDRKTIGKPRQDTRNTLVSDLGNGEVDPTKLRLAWKFEGQSLAADQLFVSGARRLKVNFTRDFSGCDLQVIYGKGSSGENIQYISRTNGKLTELLSVTVISTSCRILQGNAIAEPQ
jgi:hypothetical protein